LLNGQSWDRTDELYFEYSYVRAIRTPRYKLVKRADGFESELFDLENDPEEDRNVIDDPALRPVRSSLERGLDGFFEKIEAPPLERWRESTTQDLPTYGSR
jgi:arylsulfatase A-like enzyme